MPPAEAVEPSPEDPMACEDEALLWTTDELRDAVPTLFVLASRPVRPPEEEDELALLEDEALDDPELAVDADELVELELSLPPPPLLAAELPPPPPPPPPDRPPPPPRETVTVTEPESPELLMLTDMPPRRPASCGALSEAYRSAAVTPVRRKVRSMLALVAVTVRRVATGP